MGGMGDIHVLFKMIFLIVVTGINNQSTMKASMPSISEPARLPSLPGYQVSMSSFGHAADGDTQSTSSTPALDYKATMDGFSAPNLFD